MSCPQYGIIGESLSFNTITTSGDGSPIYADGDVTYTVYEGDTDSPVSDIVDVRMVMDTDSTGVYYSSFRIDSSKFSRYSTYFILINAVVNGSPQIKSYAFIVVGADDASYMGGISSGEINVSTKSVGNFRQNEAANFHAKIVEFEGTPIDPYSITVSVSGPIEDGSVEDIVDSGIPFKVEPGFYIYTWEIDGSQAVGTYIIDWLYIIDGVARHEYQRVVVTDSSPSSPYFHTETWKAYRAALEHHISCSQAIPVYYEQGRMSYDRQVFEFTFKNWNTSAGARIYRNQRLIDGGLRVDYDNGRVIFNEDILPQDQINADYNFRWFTDEELDRFLLNALQSMNTFAPHSSYTLENLPPRYSPAVLYGAAKDALRQLMMCLQFQQPQQVFGGIENAQKAFSNFETLKQNYEKDWEKLLEQKKLGPYPKARLVVTPEYTLPGGRSRWFRYLFK